MNSFFKFCARVSVVCSEGMLLNGWFITFDFTLFFWRTIQPFHILSLYVFIVDLIRRVQWH
jgi:hypothetical protein